MPRVIESLQRFSLFNLLLIKSIEFSYFKDSQKESTILDVMFEHGFPPSKNHLPIRHTSSYRKPYLDCQALQIPLLRVEVQLVNRASPK